MKTATELLAEMLAIHEDPERGQYWLPMWFHQHQEDVRGVVEEERCRDLGDMNTNFTCPECGSHWCTVGDCGDISTWVVHCLGRNGKCRWSGPFQGFVIDRAR